MLDLDGSEGEGGGQILRTSLALSMVTGTPVRIRNVRARRPKPGLMRQHLVAVQAAARIGGAQVTGAEIGSSTLTFIPGEVKQNYLAAGVPVGEHLADQLLLLFALAGSGAFATLPLSGHAMTQIDLIPRFLDVAIRVEGNVVRVG